MTARQLRALGLLAAFTGCGGGGAGPPADAPSVTATPTADPATAASETVGVSGAAPVALPTLSGITGTLALSGTIPAGTTATITSATGPPPNAPSAGASSIFYVWLDFSNTFAPGSVPTFSYDISTPASAGRRGLATTTYALAFYDPTQPAAGYQTVATCATEGSAVTCGGGAAGLAFEAGVTYVFALSTANASSPTPSAAPTVTASATASATAAATATAAPAAVSPTLLPFTGVDQEMTLSASGFAGTVSASTSDPTVASVTPASISSGPLQFTVTAQGAGTATVTVNDNVGDSASATVTVTITNFGFH